MAVVGMYVYGIFMGSYVGFIYYKKPRVLTHHVEIQLQQAIGTCSVCVVLDGRNRRFIVTLYVEL